ncbi:MAG: AAA family ATPase [Clostridium sp.]
MKISRIIIKNYRNLKSIDVNLNDTVALIGENNSGKSNFLRAATLPFLTDEIGFSGKNLSWIDINNDAKKEYYKFIIDKQEEIKSGSLSLEEFIKNMPIVTVEVHLVPNKTETFFVKDLSFTIEEDKMIYGLRYEYKPSKVEEIYNIVKNVVNNNKLDDLTINSVKMNLLPLENYTYSICVPNKGPISYDVLKFYKYTSLPAERDEFSRTGERLGSKSLVKLLQKGLSNDDKLKVEQEYTRFFEELKTVSNMEDIINWQEESELKDAREFFSHISILPNMPPMQSILNSIRLGYSDTELSLQGLGYRNLILLFVLVNSLYTKKEDIVLNILTIEEPEAHLCINNIRLMVSFLKALTSKNESTQLFYSTHSTEFINKMDLKNVIVMHDGQAFSFKDELTDENIDYLTKNPNLDLFKLFFSKKCILFEGISEEMLIRSYIDSQKQLSDIELLSFHKGFTKIIEIWKKVNKGTKNKLGVIRDYDNEPIAKNKHDIYDDGVSICIRTTTEYTLEPEFIKTGNNYNIIRDKYGDKFGWKDYDKNKMEEAWKDAKAVNMLIICRDILNGELPDLQMPEHIQKVLDFLNKEE